MDWMEFTDTQSLHTLDDEQIGVLISIALDDFGPGLTRTEFNDVMLWLFVSVPAWPMAGPSREAEDALVIANTPQG
jgi:hypothetical protein